MKEQNRKYFCRQSVTGSEDPKPLIFLHNNHNLLPRSLQTTVCVYSFFHEICYNNVTVNQVLLILIKVQKFVNFTY